MYRHGDTNKRRSAISVSSNLSVQPCSLVAQASFGTFVLLVLPMEDGVSNALRLVSLSVIDQHGTYIDKDIQHRKVSNDTRSSGPRMPNIAQNEIN